MRSLTVQEAQEILDEFGDLPAFDLMQTGSDDLRKYGVDPYNVLCVLEMLDAGLIQWPVES